MNQLPDQQQDTAPESSKRRGKLKQARLGTVQKKILVVLIGKQLQRHREGELFTGLPYKEIQCRLYHQAILGEAQWLQTVYAQILFEDGKVTESNQILFQGIELAASFLKQKVQNQVLAEIHPVETTLLLNELHEKAAHIQYALSLMRQAPEDADQEELHVMALSLAREISSWTVVDRYYPPYGIDGYLTLTADQKTAAEKAVTVQQASLSRALRVLEDHGLIEQVDVNFGHYSEKRYMATAIGVQRLNSEGRKIAEKR